MQKIWSGKDWRSKKVGWAGRRREEKIRPRKVVRKGEDSKCWCRNQNTAREKKTERAADNFLPYLYIVTEKGYKLHEDQHVPTRISGVMIMMLGTILRS